MTYLCNYCGVEHAMSTRSSEHIIPRKLGNHSLLLPNVCRYYNNLFARHFENAVMSSDFMREVLLEFTPAADRIRKSVYLSTVDMELPRYGGQSAYAASWLIFSFKNFNSNSIGLT